MMESLFGLLHFECLGERQLKCTLHTLQTASMVQRCKRWKHNERSIRSIMKDLYTIMEDLYTIMEDLYTIMKDLYTIMEDLYTIM
jgi:hypothetical protein